MQKVESPDGLFHEGNPVTGELGTIVSANWLNSVQGELVALVEGQGATLDPNIKNQIASLLLKTQPQFDNGKRLATTEFVQRQGHQFASVSGLSAAQTLTSAHCGTLIQLGGASSYTTKLPSLSDCTQGAEISFWSTNGNVLSLTAAGADVIYTPTGTATSTTMQQGDYLTLVAIPGLGWYSASSTSFLGKTAAFGASLSANGYQKLPSGLILQWGSGSIYAQAGMATSFTWIFPVTFPNICLAAYSVPRNEVGSSRTLEYWDRSSASCYAVNASTKTLTTSFLAIGY